MCLGQREAAAPAGPGRRLGHRLERRLGQDLKGSKHQSWRIREKARGDSLRKAGTWCGVSLSAGVRDCSGGFWEDRALSHCGGQGLPALSC